MVTSPQKYNSFQKGADISQKISGLLLSLWIARDTVHRSLQILLGEGQFRGWIHLQKMRSSSGVKNAKELLIMFLSPSK